ncbi:Ser-Thr-rich glycosyl-phosphatidyl-inositol-anchored membrane family-domain-containing protein [Aspergillus avenaceus]|uniref:Ser-Thr-rich glycosyl-phosphatidyl-inositol-anchored membrane family-domain-containing protein n=1 Tax=Aspergillus avenaceus TaxID=36643 RepID=A0A5N6TU49_ASPAV|nr:Ser-Thr-rich glycosyl-phosphatidyl-inositol-anchored membrane family-domain-containing protein [Aspergillus avenaceus]
MRFFQIASLVAYAASSVALTINSPKNGDKVDFSKPYKIEWNTVDSDPNNFTINLVGSNPRVNKEIAKSVKSSDNSYTIKSLWDIKPANGYQLNFVSADKDNTGILAQSQNFNVTKVADPPKTSKHDLSTISPAPSCTKSSTSTKTSCTKTHSSSRPCIIHSTFTPSPTPSRTPCSPPSSTTPSDSVHKASASSSTSATQTAAAPTDSTAGSAALAIPASGSLMLSLFALVL